MNRMILTRVTIAIALLALVPLGIALADSLPIDFESYTLGAIHGQDGWSSFGSVGSGCAMYDVAVADPTTFGYTTFGARSLRISNAVTSGCFGDQTFSKSLVDEAGEATATNGGLSGGTRQRYFEAEWTFASTVPSAEQPGLSVVASPDRGDGARMSWVQMKDTPSGLEVNFYDYQRGATVDPFGCCPPFVGRNVVGGLDRTTPHTIKITMVLLDGDSNDIVKVYVDGVLYLTGTSWEDYFRDNEDGYSRTVDSILFRVGGAAAPGTAGNGFLIDDLELKSGSIPKGECKNGGWQLFSNPTFKNQGDCVSYVASGGKAKGNP